MAKRTRTRSATRRTRRHGRTAVYAIAAVDSGHRPVEHGCCARLGSYPFSSYVGLDPTPEAIAQARTRADERTRFVVGDPIEIELGKFDVVICSEVLYFATDPPALIDRVGIFLVRRGHVLSSIWRHPVRSALA